jgi:thiamine-phosphate pyrophosphorylase
MLRCAITDSTAVAEDAGSRHAKLLEQAHRWALRSALDRIDLVQLREKHLEAGDLLRLAEALLQILRTNRASPTRLLINSRVDVAVAAGADGVHLTSRPGELTPAQVRTVFAHAGRPTPLVSVSCHTLDDVRRAKENRAGYILFGPVFEKRVDNQVVKDGVGMDLLRQACELVHPLPVLALGGVTEENTPLCLQAGAAGIAAIRLFR